MSLNVNRNVQDPFYRYKMPRLLAKVEGRGNGIKTVVSNMSEIARALDRPPAYPTKFFGCELGAQVQMEEGADRYIVNGSHQSDRLQELLDTFIQKFVLCANCDNPETKLRVTPKKNIEQTCVACGHRQNLDMTHKLTTFIINHPPNEVEDKKKKDKKDKEKEKKGKENKEGDSPTTPDTIDPGVATVRGNVAQRAGGGDVEAPAAVDIDENSVDWSEDTSEAAVRARQEQLGSGVAALTMTDDLEKSADERLALLHTFVKKRLGKEPFPNKEILGEAERLESKDKGVMVLVELLWDADEIGAVMERIKKYTPIMSRFCDENEKGQKYLLGAIERLIGAHPKLLPQVPRIFKELYDNDIVSEKVFFHWAEKASKKYVSKELSQDIHSKAEKFIEWLKTAETEDEDEEDEDDDDDDAGGVQVGFDSQAKGIETVKDDSAAGKGSEEDDGDLDIDAI